MDKVIHSIVEDDVKIRTVVDLYRNKNKTLEDIRIGKNIKSLLLESLSFLTEYR